MTKQAKFTMRTMKQLRNDTSGIIKQMNEDNVPVVVTRRGRFVAKITPLANVDNLEGKMLSNMPAEELEELLATADTAYPASQILKMIEEGSPPNEE